MSNGDWVLFVFHVLYLKANIKIDVNHFDVVKCELSVCDIWVFIKSDFVANSMFVYLLHQCTFPVCLPVTGVSLAIV